MVVARQAMPKRVAMNVSLTVELASFVAEKVASGRYGSASEVVRTSLRLLEEREPRFPPAPSTASQADTARHEP
jgi:antitoxin ParD1/3/4